MSDTPAVEIIESTASYEAWLARFAPLNKSDLDAKHEAMAQDAFRFLRGTFYRWAQLFPVVCSDVAAAPEVLAVGDLHAENFGTWRDAEGRLAWGVNDFDEAFRLPYTNDLVRLATSVFLANESEHLSVDPKVICEAILDGYGQRLKTGGQPIVIDENHRWFVPILERQLKASDPGIFWNHLREALASNAKGRVPASATAALKRRLPEGCDDVTIKPRRAGVGSLGKPRFVATAHWVGAPVAREIKVVTPSACVWAKVVGTGSKKASGKSQIPELIELLTNQGLRCSDPFYHVDDQWIGRRLAADSRKIELNASPHAPDEIRMLEAMGKETANVHLGSAKAIPAIRKDLAKRGANWLYKAAVAMCDTTKQEQKAWARGRARKGD